MTDNSPLSTFFRLVRAFFLATSTLTLGFYVYLASFARPLGDDYCFSAWNAAVGPLVSGLYKYQTTSNRFSNQFIVYFSDLFGPRGVGLLSVLVILLWVGALTYLLSQLARAFKIEWDVWTGLLAAELIALTSLYSAANLFQAVFWRPGLMTYFLPLPLFAFVFAFILRAVRLVSERGVHNARPSLWMVTGLFFAAFFIGGLSETTGALHITLLILALAGNFFWNKGPGRRTALGLVTAALAGALLAMAGMFLAPANAFRIQAGSAPTWPELVQRIFTFGFQFLLESVRLLRQPAAFALGVGAILSYAYVRFRDAATPSTRHLLIALVAVPLITHLLIMASFAPSAYGQSYPAERVRFPAQVLVIIMFLLEGAWLGMIAARTSLPRWSMALAILAMLVASLYPLWIIRNNLPRLFQYENRTAQWDERDAHIRELAASGQTDIVVWEVRGIDGVKDLDPSPRQWVNYCAAMYYGVHTISAP